jgi:hypothetical protein
LIEPKLKVTSKKDELRKAMTSLPKIRKHHYEESSTQAKGKGKNSTRQLKEKERMEYRTDSIESNTNVLPVQALLRDTTALPPITARKP